MEKRIAAIIVTFNRKELLFECIESLLKQTFQTFDILIIDNASTDGTKEALSDLMSKGAIKYYNTGANLGGAGGFNYGIHMAARQNYDYVWIMDDDTMPTPSALKMLIKAARRIKRYGYLSSKTLWVDDTLCRMNIQRNRRMHNIKDFGKRYIPSGAATFVSLFLPMEVVRQIGLPISDFFIWADDLEYTRRISRKMPCYVVTDSVVIHKCGTNNGGNISTDSEDRLGRYEYAYRNEVYLYKREGLQGYAHLLMRTPLHIVRVLRYSDSKKLKRIGIILKSTGKGFFFHPDIEYPKSDEFSRKNNEYPESDEFSIKNIEYPKSDEFSIKDIEYPESDKSSRKKDECPESVELSKKKDINRNKTRDISTSNKVLEVNVDDKGLGGVYSLVRSVILSGQAADKIDIACIAPFEDEDHIKELSQVGTDVYYIGHKGLKLMRPWYYTRNLYKLCKKNKYTSVHIHGDVAYLMAMFGLAARMAGCHNIILHSHAAGIDGGSRKLKYIAHRACRHLLKNLGDQHVACSDVAGEWMYPFYNKEDIILINNGRDLAKYMYDPEKRKEERARLGYDKELVLGHVGRFAYQKNHDYLIDIFSEIRKRIPQARLLLVGEGPLEDEIRKKVEDLSLGQDVCFYGKSERVCDLLQAMDIFLLPSFFEGLPVVGVEAQAAGLPVIFSDQITQNAKIGPEVSFLPINKSDIGKWVEKIESLKDYQRKDTSMALKKAGYDIEDTIKQFGKLYV